jgi:hypothetical protein
MLVAEKLDWKELKIKKSVGNRKIIMSDEVRHRIGSERVKLQKFSEVLMNANPNIISKYGGEENCNFLQLTAVFVLVTKPDTLCQQRPLLGYLGHVLFSGIW